MSEAAAQTANLPAVAPRAEVAVAARPALPARPLTLAEKAAVVLVALGPETAKEILGAMGDDGVRLFARTVSRIDQVPHHQVVEVLEEFLALVGDELTLRGGAEAARNFLVKVVGPDGVARIMEDLSGKGGRSLWTRLGDTPDPQLANWLHTEHPQVIAVILSKLRSVQAARILERLEDALAREVVLRMGRAPRIEPRALEIVSAIIERDVVVAAERTQGVRKPTEVIANLMNHVGGEVREALLKHMEETDAKLAQEVQKLMFTFADIADRVAARDVAQIVKAVDEPVLLAALKTARAAQDPAADFILNNIPKRLSERLIEDMEMMDDIRQKEGEAAQGEVIQAILTLAKQGTIKLIRQDEDE
ncbi:flagellar motor switch protein FliG [Oceanicella actignis]|uniref:Flagellar motor switch protein FliG n=1 Tax=Oceanicella actignis TaxID=1189325 RepID=A0A1M7T910_9RHOB|nr:FliG C-terminal domain-containing protein [Oceanicella actignis]TYO89107.1 flagellar motor switch protein FliG [Oceanicella actignis]SET50035.1 flagellar motor switch protein FliG [Oceanicella actignis]SHN67168.1 flagellar motor switch protein FliG [Oceanicella actignis]